MGRPLWSWYIFMARKHTPALLNPFPSCIYARPYGATQVRLVSYTHGRRNRSSARSYVWVNMLKAYSVSLRVKRDLFSKSVLTKTHGMLQEDSYGADVQSEVKIPFMSRCSRFKSGYL